MTTAPLLKRYRPERHQAAQKRHADNPLNHRSGREILAALGRYGYLTAPQIQRLLYSPGSRTHVATWNKHLRQAGYAHDENWLRVNSEGANPRVWTFTEKGRQWLEANEATELPRIHHRRLQEPWVLDHTIAVNEALITCELLATRSGGQIQLLGLRSDELLHKRPITVVIEGKTQSVIPDGWVAYGIGEKTISLCLEVDRATEDPIRWRRKIAGYLKALGGDPSPYEERFGYPASIILTVVRPKALREPIAPEKRLADLKAWTEAELAEQRKQSWGALFKFTLQAPEATNPRVFLGGPVWETPFRGGKEPVLPGLA